MTANKENIQRSLLLWQSRKGIFLQIIIVLLPSILFLNSGKLLLAGLIVSTFLSWMGLRLQRRQWSDVGLKRPLNFKKVFLIAIISTVVLVPLSYWLRQLVISLTHQAPNLEQFKVIEGNGKALVIGLVVVWVFGAFCEEMLFRGFLMSCFYKLLPDNFNSRIKWGLSLCITSSLVAFGHTYQGITGMILTGIVGFCFGLIYLSNKGNLWPCILTHGLYDTVAFLLIFFGFNLDQLFK